MTITEVYVFITIFVWVFVFFTNLSNMVADDFSQQSKLSRWGTVIALAVSILLVLLDIGILTGYVK